MPAITRHDRISNIVVLGGGDLRLSELAIGYYTSIVGISSTIAPTTGVLTDLIDYNTATEVVWAVGGGIPSITITVSTSVGAYLATYADQASGGTVNGQIYSAIVESSTDEVSWTVVGNQPWITASAINTYATPSTTLAVIIVENISDIASTSEALEDNLFFLADTAGSSDAATNQIGSNVAVADTAVSGESNSFQYAYLNSHTDSANVADTLAASTFTMYLEAIGLSDTLTAGANTTSTLTDSAAMRDIIQQAINQIVADTANGADSLSLGAALTLVDVADAVATQSPSYNSVMLVAELIATLEAYNGADAYDITEAGTLSDTYVARVEALVALLEAAQVVDTNTALVHVMQLATDSADGAAEITSTGSLLNALLADSVLATIRINIGGELFTGWVLNTDTLAPSEYQFADLQFNSACKHGGTYLLAADDGIYQFTEDTGVETVMTYIKTGKTDFGSDLKKRIVNSYMVYSASGQMVLKVTTSEFGKLVTRNYRMTPQADDTTATRRIDIGKGVTSRYWQFEVVGDGVDCDIDEIGMLPVVLSRRI